MGLAHGADDELLLLISACELRMQDAPLLAG
jgi:hypothetical protein